MTWLLVLVAFVVGTIIQDLLYRRRIMRHQVRILALEKVQMWKKVAAEEGTPWARLMFVDAQAAELATRKESVLWKPL